MDKIKLPSNKSFGIVFFFVFTIIALYPLLNNHEIRFWSLIIGFIFTSWIAGRIYRVGILMYGQKVNYKTLWKWIKQS